VPKRKTPEEIDLPASVLDYTGGVTFVDAEYYDDETGTVKDPRPVWLAGGKRGKPAGFVTADEALATEESDAVLHELESGARQAKVLDPWSGELHDLKLATWRRWDADTLLRNGTAPIPNDDHHGVLFIAAQSRKPQRVSRSLSAKETDAIVELLRATPDKTNPEQEAAVAEKFPDLHITDRRWREIRTQAGLRTPGRKRS
jgi:hypothetical protein